ncbi:MAG: nicotinate-nucleotide--dimethylbenzimidazole phosphoribosyltransferase [Dehalococcoidia bacterium]|jgi:nicotinate-nucleotide--dimethylbenzimidazole phosphoribosyltransferase
MANALSKVIEAIEPPDEKAMEAARKRQDELTKPRGSLGDLEELSVKIAGIRRSPLSTLENKAIVVMAADHGVVAEGVSAYPQAVTRQMVANFLNDHAAINILAGQAGVRPVFVDMGVIGGFEPHPSLLCKMIDFGTRNMAKGPAMSRRQALGALKAGVEVVEAQLETGLDIMGTGEMGIGNTTAASAIAAAVTGLSAAELTGTGTGINEKQLAHKIELVERALAVNQPSADDAVDILAKVGGFEIGGLAGAILAAAANRVPVVIDGFISGAAALIAVKLAPRVRDYLIAAHLSAERGHRAVLGYMGLRPLLNLKMRLGEGTGAALGIFLAEASVKLLKDMLTFDEAGVSDKDGEVA